MKPSGGEGHWRNVQWLSWPFAEQKQNKKSAPREPPRRLKWKQTTICARGGKVRKLLGPTRPCSDNLC